MIPVPEKSKMKYRIFPKKIYSCFQCDCLDFTVTYPPTYYNMECNHPKGGLEWKDKCPDRDSRPYGFIPDKCPLQYADVPTESHSKRLLMIDKLEG